MTAPVSGASARHPTTVQDRRRRIVAWGLSVAAAVLYLADLLGLKPPPRVLPSVVLAGAAVLLGVTARDPGSRPPRPSSTRDRVMSTAGLVLQVLLFVPILPIGLIAPGSGVLAIHGIWLAALVVAWHLRRSNPAAVLAIPFLTAAALAGVIWIGTTMLGWQP